MAPWRSTLLRRTAEDIHRQNTDVPTETISRHKLNGQLKQSTNIYIGVVDDRREVPRTLVTSLRPLQDVNKFLNK